ncbi:alpha/beta hydrolase family esterase [Nocardia terrae]|uniref:alpha/beta hydrolase family esterase n=1 Tax=Nocardia terrae TaxID=2675851 RepID=UPI0012F94BA2|nr:MoaD/ThiS family protein [Nocardia terrae]
MAVDLVEAEVTIEGLRRAFAIRPPSRKNAPIVLVLHGNQSGMTDAPAEPLMYEWTSFARHADEWGIGVAYPLGWGGCWADGRGVTTADEAGVDDVAFLRAVIDWCAERFETQADRAVVAGISNGAFMAHRMAVEAGDRVAVFAAVAGGFPEALAGIRPGHAVSAVLINGDADPMVPLTGGFSRHRGPGGELRGRTWGLTESARHWREVDGCAGPGETVTTQGSTRTAVSRGTGGTVVMEWTVFGGGHTWPGTPVPERWAGTPGSAVSLEFDAAEEIWRFAAPLLIPADARKL